MEVDLPDDESHAVLGLAMGTPIERELLEAWDGGRVERAGWTDPSAGTPRGACLKYGNRTSLRCEALLYSAVFDPPRDPVPELVGCRPLGGGWLLALRWVEGRRPDFTDAADVSRVSGALGSWLGDWNKRLQQCTAADALCKHRVDRALRGDLDALWADRCGAAELRARFTEATDGALGYVAAALEAGGTELLEALQRTAARAPELAERIAVMPETLDWGDFSENNVIVHEASVGVTFLDLEFAALRPVPLVLECLSEAYATVPQGALRDLAVDEFAAAWNRTEGQPLPISAFRASVRAAWLLYKVGQLEDWLKGWAEGEHTEELKIWIQSTARATLEVLTDLDRV